VARYVIEHRTRFEYAGPVRESVMELRMRPHDGGGQSCERFALSISPQTTCSEYVDPYGNVVCYFTLPRPHQALQITAEATVDVSPPASDAAIGTAWTDLAALSRDRALSAWLNPSVFARPSAALELFAVEVYPHDALPPLHWLAALQDRLRKAIRYLPNSTSVNSPIEECLAQRAGVCQDFAHVFIALARRKGIPCRYVSGYLFHRLDQVERSGEDSTHAWAEAFVPGLGWRGFDAANGVAAGDGHIRVAVGRDYHDVPPTRGVYRGPATRRHEVQVRVQRVGPPAGAAEEVVTVNGFHCQVQQRDTGVVAQLVGSLGAGDAGALEQQLAPAMDAKPRRVILDLTGLQSIGSAGVGALVKLQRKVESAGGQFVLAAVPPQILKVFVFSRLDRVFAMAPGVDEALGD
jgi:anti-anti-sigma factor